MPLPRLLCAMLSHYVSPGRATFWEIPHFCYRGDKLLLCFELFEKHKESWCKSLFTFTVCFSDTIRAQSPYCYLRRFETKAILSFCCMNDICVRGRGQDGYNALPLLSCFSERRLGPYHRTILQSTELVSIARGDDMKALIVYKHPPYIKRLGRGFSNCQVVYHLVRLPLKSMGTG